MSEVAFCQTLWGKVEVDMGDELQCPECGSRSRLHNKGCSKVEWMKPYEPDFTCCPLCGGGWNPKGGCAKCGSPVAVTVKLNERRALFAAGADVPSPSADLGEPDTVSHTQPRKSDGVLACVGCGCTEGHLTHCHLWRSNPLMSPVPLLSATAPDFSEAEEAVRVLLRSCGVNPDHPSVVDTPHRVVRALDEMTQGYDVKPADILSKQFDCDSDEMVVLRGIEFTSLCEHHMLPFVGTADVGYLPPENGKVVGLSKIARLVDCFAKRLQLQERMTREIASALMDHLNARGAAVVVRARHACMGCRGVQKPDATMITSCTLGLFRSDPVVRQEFLTLCGRV